MQHEVLVKTSNGPRVIQIHAGSCSTQSKYPSENDLTIGLLKATWIALLADSPISKGRKPLKTYLSFLKALEDPIKVIVLFADLAHRLVSSDMHYGSATAHCEWIDEFKDTPVFYEFHRFYNTGDTAVLQFLYTFLNFGKKLDYVDELLDETAFRSWSRIEDELAELSLPSVLTQPLRSILKEVLSPFSFDELYPKFGPGSVSERGVRGRVAKVETLSYDALIDRFLFHGHIGKYGQGRESGIHPDKVIPDPSRWTPANGLSSRTARLKFVPKSVKVSRSICMEPNTMMYFQQAVARRMIELIRAGPLGRFIRLEDQSRNRLIALDGSQTTYSDTIDLSAASDRLSFELVKKIFGPSWLIPMIVTRSSRVELLDGSERSIKKFAPMGSALCFPVQCIVFASVCILAASMYTSGVSHVDGSVDLSPSHIRRVIGLFQDSFTNDQGVFQPLAVYGDDICVDSRLTPIIKSILCHLGFVVNDEKSFTGPQKFRESCGGFYHDGADVTPLYFRVKGVRSSLTPSHVASHVHLINALKARKYYCAYEFSRKTLMTWGRGDNRPNPIPYVDNPQLFGIHSSNPVNVHLQVRENAAWQRTEARAWTISYAEKLYGRENPHAMSTEVLQAVDAYEYMRWWASRDEQYSDGFNKPPARYDVAGTKLRWRWIPV